MNIAGLFAQIRFFRRWYTWLPFARKFRLYPIVGLVREQVGPPPVTRSANRNRRPPRKAPIMTQFSITDSQEFDLTIGWADKKGNPAPAPTGVTLAFSSENEAVVTATPLPDGSGCTVKAVGPLSLTGVTVSVTASDASGNAVAAGAALVIVTSGAPTVITLSGGTPREQQP